MRDLLGGAGLMQVANGLAPGGADSSWYSITTLVNHPALPWPREPELPQSFGVGFSGWLPAAQDRWDQLQAPHPSI